MYWNVESKIAPEPLVARPPLRPRPVQFPGLLPPVQMSHHLPGEHPQRVPLFGGQGAGDAVDDAQGAQGVPGGRGQRHPGVEPDVRVSRHQRVGPEPLVGGGVRDDEHFGLTDGVVAERVDAGRVGDGQPDAGLEPLTVSVDQADQRNRSAADARGQLGEVVEVGLGRSVENVEVAQFVQPVDLVRGERGDHRHPHDAAGSWRRRPGSGDPVSRPMRLLASPKASSCPKVRRSNPGTPPKSGRGVLR
jgi:hypothetical protein